MQLHHQNTSHSPELLHNIVSVVCMTSTSVEIVIFTDSEVFTF